MAEQLLWAGRLEHCICVGSGNPHRRRFAGLVLDQDAARPKTDVLKSSSNTTQSADRLNVRKRYSLAALFMKAGHKRDTNSLDRVGFTAC